jgi:hypothetical protein
MLAIDISVKCLQMAFAELGVTTSRVFAARTGPAHSEITWRTSEMEFAKYLKS